MRGIRYLEAGTSMAVSRGSALQMRLQKIDVLISSANDLGGRVQNSPKSSIWISVSPMSMAANTEIIPLTNCDGPAT